MPNSATLVQALYAAFCAILCACFPLLSGMGGGSMMCGARVGTWAKSGGWVNPYITDGLVAMWDGEWNAGGGIHDPNATVWKDLVGNQNRTSIFVGDNFTIGNNSSLNGYYIDHNLTLECVVCVTNRSYKTRTIFGIGDDPFGSCGLIVDGDNYTGYDPNQPGLAFRVNYSGQPYGYAMRSGVRYVDVNTLTIVFDYASKTYCGYANGVYVGRIDISELWDKDGIECSFSFPQSQGESQSEMYANGIKRFRGCYYDRALTAEEVAHNYAIDRTRFNLT